MEGVIKIITAKDIKGKNEIGGALLSAESATADLNGKATLMACTEILKRLKTVAASALQANESDIEFIDEIIYCNNVA